MPITPLSLIEHSPIQTHESPSSIPPPIRELPPQTELLILWTLKGVSGGVYGLDIERAIRECSGGEQTISTGSLYSLLKRLRQKGYVDSHEGDAVGGGAKRQYYHLTDLGKRVVDDAIEFFARLQRWQP